MARFILVYKGPATDMAAMTEAQSKAVMDCWNAWIGKLGAALLDVGAPFGPGTSIVDDGKERKPDELNGYSIVEAADLAAARGLAKAHPFLSEGKGRFSLEVYELMPVPM